MKSSMFAPAPLILVAATGMFICGCGGSGELATAPVKGTVMYQGKPLSSGTISFQPEAGSPATGKIQPDGSFTLSTYGEGDGAIVGKHKVSVFATAADAGAAAAGEANTETPVGQSVIPTKYSSFSTSGLTAEVVAGGANEPVFELMGEAPKPVEFRPDSV